MAKKVRVPKRIAGVKLPRSLRRGLKDLAARDSGKTLIAATFAAADGALSVAESKAAPKKGPKTAKAGASKGVKVKRVAVKGVVQITPGSARLADAANSFINTLKSSAPAP